MLRRTTPDLSRAGIRFQNNVTTESKPDEPAYFPPWLELPKTLLHARQHKEKVLSENIILRFICCFLTPVNYVLSRGLHTATG